MLIKVIIASFLEMLPTASCIEEHMLTPTDMPVTHLLASLLHTCLHWLLTSHHPAGPLVRQALSYYEIPSRSHLLVQE